MCPETQIASRPYQLHKRAETMAATRRRITEAAVELHGTEGPARTTISAVAEHAGVQRHTVYRHFPTEAELFAACSGHFMDQHPWPDPGAWREIADPVERVRHALNEVYAYYERTEPMFTNVLRDEAVVPALGPALVPFREFLDTAARALAGEGRQRRLLLAATCHVLDFQTWRSLTREGGLNRRQAIDLAVAMVEGVAAR